MNTRIRYSKPDVNGSATSMQILKAFDGTEYRVIMDLNERVATIITPKEPTSVMVAQVKAVSLGRLKIAVKAKLKELGVGFGTETRSKL